MLAGLFRSVHHVFRLLVQTLNEYGLFSGLIISSRRSRIGNNNFKQHQLYVHENWNMTKLNAWSRAIEVAESIQCNDESYLIVFDTQFLAMFLA